jgi:small ligand-binding sensory domain FIST
VADQAPIVAAASEGFAAALATGEDWGQTVQRCLEALGDPPQGANLGFVYGTDALAEDMTAITSALREGTGVDDWVGTVGLGVAGGAVEVYGQPALAVLVAALPDDGYRILQATPEPLAARHGAWLERHKPGFGIVHGDPRNQAIAELVAGLSNETSSYLVGGLTASHSSFPQVAGRVGEGGLSGVLFDSELQVVTGLTQGCTPIGPVRTITEAEENVIVTLDGRPAFEVFQEDIGELLARDLRRVEGYIYVALPIRGTDTGDYLVRNLVGLDGERGLIAVGELVEAGQTLMFCRRDHDAAEADLKRMLADVKRRSGGQPKAGVYYSCIARGQNLFGQQSEELGFIRDALGEFPLAGFFANGEICNERLYGYTGVLALFL